jgi:DNA-directed RNA polymerase subunit RPC12/RpoP
MVVYRCEACGNRTRFDVFETKSVRAFHHFTLGGEVSIEEEEILEHEITKVACRWCGSADSIVAEENADSDAETNSGRPRTDAEQSGRPRTDAEQSGRPRTDAEQSGRPRTDAEQSGRPRTDAEQSGRPRTDAETE